MKTFFTLRKILLAVFLAGLELNCLALSMGPLSGTAVVGRPLDVAATVRFDSSQDAQSACIKAEVLYGESKLHDNAVRVSVERTTELGRAAVARIVSSAVVDEPVVTLILQAGCGQKTVRQYLMLADAPLDKIVLAAQPVGVVVAVPGAATRGRMADVAATATRVKSGANAADGVRWAGGSPARQPDVGLQLAVWESGPERSPWLRVSAGTLSMPTSDGAQRAAAAALWQALTVQPQDLLKTVDRLRYLESELANLRELSGKNRVEMTSLRQLLNQAQDRRTLEFLPAGALLLLAVAVAAFFWRPLTQVGARSPMRNWHPAVLVGELSNDHFQQTVRDPSLTGSVAVPTVNLLTVTQTHYKASDSKDFYSGRLPLETRDAAHDERGGPQLPGHKVVALQGAQQQADFFASLGQFDEAICVLSAYIGGDTEASPLAYLELFRMYHCMDRREEFEHLRQEFGSVFALVAPVFDEMDSAEAREQEAGGLEAYPLPLSRIAENWPSPDALDTIENLLFLFPRNGFQLFSAEAYRELLWLYAMGQAVAACSDMTGGLELLEDVGLQTNCFILPWDVVGNRDGSPELSWECFADIDVAPASAGLGVDIDLGEPSAVKAAPALAETHKEDEDLFDAAMGFESRRPFARH